MTDAGLSSGVFNTLAVEHTAKDLCEQIDRRGGGEQVGLVVMLAELIPADGGGEYRQTPGSVELVGMQNPRLICGRDGRAVDAGLEQILAGMLAELRARNNTDEEVDG